MQAYAETASKAVTEAENALRTALEKREPSYEEFEPLLESLRKLCLDQIFLTFPSSIAKSAEDRLWESHVRVNKKFQKHLKQFREGSGKKKHVERRKAEKLYLGFIKASMHFYRGYIQRLASNFRNVQEVAIIVDRLHLEAVSGDAPISMGPAHTQAVLASCHSALMRLGDLSRYRETELETKNRNWGPAKGHYQLALSVKPESGAAYNQLAVMALADDDHLRAVYYLHRAAATYKPFPVAEDNIKLEFEKLLKLEPEEKSAIADTSKQTLEVLENRFLAFHANCHTRPGDFIAYTEKSTQILQLITVSFGEINDQSLDKLLQKMCLVSIVAEHLARKGASTEHGDTTLSAGSQTEREKRLDEKRRIEHERNYQAMFLLQRFNVLTFTTLLKTLARELADGGGSADLSDPTATAVSLPVQRLLPHLRQYSSWLLSNIKALLNPKHPSTEKCLEQFWRSYAIGANLLVSQFSIADILDVDHLLEEDVNTLSFAPFSQNVVSWRYHFENNSRKPVSSAQGQENTTNAEMLARIRRFVFDAATITNQKAKLDIDWAPLALVNGEFVYEERKVQPVIQRPKTPPQPFRRSERPFSPVSSPKSVGHTSNGLHVRSPNHSRSPRKPTEVQSSLAATMTTIPGQLDSSSLSIGTPGVSQIQGQNYPNVKDLMQSMMQPPVAMISNPSQSLRSDTRQGNGILSGLMPTNHLSPRLGEVRGFASRPGTASGQSPSDPWTFETESTLNYQAAEQPIAQPRSPFPFGAIGDKQKK